MLHFRYGAASHVGLVRDHNEDAGFAGSLPPARRRRRRRGGCREAAATTSYVVTALTMARRDQDAAELLAEAVATAQAELRRGSQEDVVRRGMATTLTALLARGHRVTLDARRRLARLSAPRR